MMIKKGDKTSDLLESVPGVGKSIAGDLRELGVQKVSDLMNKDPQKLYGDLCRKRGFRIDPCVLYVFRCAVYYSENDNHNPELLKWWKWKEVIKLAVVSEK
jgi:hypothetical protein